MVGDRRAFLVHLGRRLAGTVVDTVTGMHESLSDREAPDAAEAPRPWVRPPGALPEAEFRKVCTQCTDCQQACPYQSIRRLGPEWGPDAGTPAIIPTESPCYLCPDMPCIAACEPRALIPTLRGEIDMGLAVIDMPGCYAVQGQPCDYCATRCPIGPSAIRFDTHRAPVVDPEGCTGCGVCAYLCPADAIHIGSPA